MNKCDRQSLLCAMEIGRECLGALDVVDVSEKGDIEPSMDYLVDLMCLIRLLSKYQRFDLEATRRERDKLQHMMDDSGDDDE